MLTLLFHCLCLSAKSTLTSLADKEGAADMIFCSTQKLVTKRVTCISEKHLGVAKTLTHVENALFIFAGRSHKWSIYSKYLTIIKKLTYKILRKVSMKLYNVLIFCV